MPKDSGGHGWPIFVMIGLTAATIVAGTGGSIESSGQQLDNVRGWYIAAGWIFGAVAFLTLAKFVVWPSLMRLNAWRVRTLANAEASTPPGREGRPARRKRASDLTIGGAIWETPNQRKGVTDVLTSLITDGRLDFMASNGVLTPGDDIDMNVPKRLVVRYSIGGREATRTFNEGDQVVLP